MEGNLFEGTFFSNFFCMLLIHFGVEKNSGNIIPIIIFSRFQRELMSLVICLSPLFTNKRTERFWLAVLQVSLFVLNSPFKNTENTFVVFTRSNNQLRNQQPILFIPKEYVKFLSASYSDANKIELQEVQWQLFYNDQ